MLKKYLERNCLLCKHKRLRVGQYYRGAFCGGVCRKKYFMRVAKRLKMSFYGGKVTGKKWLHWFKFGEIGISTEVKRNGFVKSYWLYRGE